MEALSVDAAEDLLEDRPLVPAMQGSIPEMKALRERCLEAGIPALVGCPGGGRSCGPKTHLLVQEDDLGRLGELLRDEWAATLAREELPQVEAQASEDGEPPCPACGTAAPLVEGACSDCGLRLE